MLDGKKTYISALVLGLATLVRALNWVTQEQYELILGLSGSAGLAALRAGVATPKAGSTDVPPVSSSAPAA